eukprot:4409636-Pyramimonas_sp.AAC.1
MPGLTTPAAEGSVVLPPTTLALLTHAWADHPLRGGVCGAPRAPGEPKWRRRGGHGPAGLHGALPAEPGIRRVRGADHHAYRRAARHAAGAQ